MSLGKPALQELHPQDPQSQPQLLLPCFFALTIERTTSATAASNTARTVMVPIFSVIHAMLLPPFTGYFAALTALLLRVVASLYFLKNSM